MKDNPSFQKYFDKAVKLLALKVKEHYIHKCKDSVKAAKIYQIEIDNNAYLFNLKFGCEVEQSIKEIKIQDYNECIKYLLGEEILINHAIDLVICSGYDKNSIDLGAIATLLLQIRLRKHKDTLVKEAIKLLSKSM